MKDIDEETKKIILSFLMKWKTSRVSEDKLIELKEEIIKKKGIKSLPFSTLRKWVRKLVKETKQAEKLKEIQLSSPISIPISEKAFQQALEFDIRAIKKITEKTLEDINRIRAVVSKKPKNFKKIIAPQIATTRKILEKISSKITEIEKKIS